MLTTVLVWKKVFTTPTVVFMYRHPLEVAASLEKYAWK